MCLQRSRGKCRFRTLCRKSEWCCRLSLCLQASRKVGSKKWSLFIKMYPYLHILHTYTCSIHAFKLLQMSVSEDWLYFLLFHLPCLFLLPASSPLLFCIICLSVITWSCCPLPEPGWTTAWKASPWKGWGWLWCRWLSLYDLLPWLTQAQGLVFFPPPPSQHYHLKLVFLPISKWGTLGALAQTYERNCLSNKGYRLWCEWL